MNADRFTSFFLELKLTTTKKNWMDRMIKQMKFIAMMVVNSGILVNKQKKKTIYIHIEQQQKKPV